jgi:hypothetical protein
VAREVQLVLQAPIDLNEARPCGVCLISSQQFLPSWFETWPGRCCNCSRLFKAAKSRLICRPNRSDRHEEISLSWQERGVCPNIKPSGLCRILHSDRRLPARFGHAGRHNPEIGIMNGAALNWHLAPQRSKAFSRPDEPSTITSAGVCRPRPTRFSRSDLAGFHVSAQ